MNNFERARREAGYTQAKLAEELGVSQQAISNWEDGKATPRAKLLVKLSILLDRSVEYLLK